MTQRMMHAWTLAVGLGACGAAGAQEGTAPIRGIDKGRVELSIAASFANSSGEDNRESATIVNLPLRVGVFVTRRAELEGELLFTHASGGGDANTGAIGSGRLLYHFGDDARAVPFVSAGGGVGNGVEFFGAAIDTQRTVRHFELGAGVKSFVGDSAAVRLEYRFARFSWTAERAFSIVDPPGVHMNTHRVFAGISFFFR